MLINFSLTSDRVKYFPSNGNVFCANSVNAESLNCICWLLLSGSVISTLPLPQIFWCIIMRKHFFHKLWQGKTHCGQNSSFCFVQTSRKLQAKLNFQYQQLIFCFLYFFFEFMVFIFYFNVKCLIFSLAAWFLFSTSILMPYFIISSLKLVLNLFPEPQISNIQLSRTYICPAWISHRNSSSRLHSKSCFYFSF